MDDGDGTATIAVAFYRGWGRGPKARLLNAAMKLIMRDRAGHVEVALAPAPDGTRPALVACVDAAVALRPRRFDDRWEVVEVLAPAEAVARAHRLVGRRFDPLGVVLAAFAPRWAARRRSGGCICTEIAATALGLPDPQAWSIGRLRGAVASAGGPRPRSAAGPR